MIKLNHNLSLDLYYNEEKTIDTKEYDKNSRYITVSLTYKGKEYQISDDSVKARIKWLKPDKKAVFNDCVINSDNTITIDLTEQMLITSGVAKATLSLYDINTDQVLSTTSFNAIVEASAVSDDTILSSDEFKTVQSEFKKLDELNKTVTECENIRQKNEETRNANEDIRNTNENNRISAENARIDSENIRIENENTRIENEKKRITNENTRQQNETTRETQEDKRQSDTTIAISNANNAAKNANDKANDLQTKLDNHHFVLTNELENTISSDSTTTAPTANAVKIVNDKLDSHTNNHDNPHNITKEQIGLGNNDNTADMDKPVSTAQQKAIDDAYANSNKYTDKKIADLIGGAPETLDTLKEVADAISASKSTEEALNSAIGTKANQAELDTHTGNDTIHITSDERENWNDANDKKHTHSNKSVLDGITSALITAWNNAVEHITDTVKHITSSERTKWNAAYDKANNALPKTGGTLTGSLDIYGNASQNPLRTRGIVGSDGQGSDGDLYLQYGTDNNVYLGKSGKSCIDSEGYFYQIGNKVLDSKNYTSIMTKQGVCDILGYTPATGTDNLEIGGTNLFHGTKEFEITNAKSFSNTVSSITSETYNGLKIRKNLTAWNFYRPILSLESGNYVFSGYVKGVNGLPATIQVNVGDTVLNSYVFSITSDFKRYSITFEITEKSDVTFYLESRKNGEIYECGWKLERGNKATDWSPAPEDLESALSICDYNDTSKKIKVGWVGSALNEDQILAIACYASGDDDIVKAKIKDVSKATFKNWLGTVSPSDGSNNYVKVFNSSNVNSSDDLTVNDLADQGFAAAMIAATEDSPIGSGWFHALNLGWGNSKNNWVSQIALGTQPNDGLYYRTTGASIVGKPWKRVLDSSNYTNYALKNENLSDIDLNNVTTTGIYHLTGKLTNNPLSCNATLFVDFSVGTPYQIFIPDYAYVMYKRTYSNGAWGSWVYLNDYIPISGTTSLAGSIVPNEDVAMDLGDSTHRFTNVYSSNITTGAIWMEHDSNAIYESGNDAANGNGGGLNNLVVRSWWGVSFTSNCAGGRYGGGNQTAVGIDCREGIVKAYNFAGLINGHSVNADVPSNATYIESYGSSDNYVFSDCYGSGSGTNYYYIRYTNGIQMIFIEIHNDNSRQNVSQGSGKKTISFPVSFVNNKYFAFGKQNISSDASGNNLVSFSEKNTSSIDVRHYPYGYNEAADYFSMFFVGRWK